MELLKFNRYEVLIDGTDYTNHVPFPLKWSELLDEQLDEASLQLVRVSIDNFEPLTNVTIKVWNDGAPDEVISHNFIVANDEAKEVPVGSGKYNHTLYLIEETKYLEGFQVRSHGYVDSLKDTYRTTLVSPAVDDESIFNAPLSFSKLTSSTSKVANRLPTPAYIVRWQEGKLQFKSEGCKIEVFQGAVKILEISGDAAVAAEPFNVETETGSVTITYSITCTANALYTFKLTYTLICTFLALSGTKWNARTIIERALILAEPLRQNDCPRF